MFTYNQNGSRAGLFSALNQHCYNPATYNPSLCSQYATAVGFIYGPEAIPAATSTEVLAASLASTALASGTPVKTTTLAAATYSLGNVNTSTQVCSGGLKQSF